MEQGSKEMKLQGRYPEYTVYSHPIPQRALAIATLLLQMKNSEQVDDIILCDGNFGMGVYIGI